MNNYCGERLYHARKYRIDSYSTWKSNTNMHITGLSMAHVIADPIIGAKRQFHHFDTLIILNTLGQHTTIKMSSQQVER